MKTVIFVVVKLDYQSPAILSPLQKVKRKLITNSILSGSSGRISNNKLTPNNVEWWLFRVSPNAIHHCPVLHQSSRFCFYQPYFKLSRNMICSRVTVFLAFALVTYGFVVHWDFVGTAHYSLKSCESHLKTLLKIYTREILWVVTKKRWTCWMAGKINEMPW